jgi:hypothetical protein
LSRQLQRRIVRSTSQRDPTYPTKPSRARIPEDRFYTRTMSARSVALLRPACRPAIQSSNFGGRFNIVVTAESLRNGVSQPAPGSPILLAHITQQRRAASNLPSNNRQIGRPRPIVRQPSVGAILRKALDFSWIYNSAGRQGFRRLFRDSPEELILALVL